MKIYVNNERENFFIWLEAARKSFKTEFEMCYRRGILKKDNKISFLQAFKHLKKSFNHVRSEWFKNYVKLDYSPWTCKCGHYRGIKFSGIKCNFCQTNVKLKTKKNNIMSGKGDSPRNCFSKQFKNNYDEINWGHEKKEKKQIEEKPPELKNKEIISFD